MVKKASHVCLLFFHISSLAEQTVARYVICARPYTIDMGEIRDGPAFRELSLSQVITTSVAAAQAARARGLPP